MDTLGTRTWLKVDVSPVTVIPMERYREASAIRFQVSVPVCQGYPAGSAPSAREDTSSQNSAANVS